MVLGQIVELCVSVVIIVNYCAQCELLIFYLREIGLRMEEKTKDLSIIMKVIILVCFCDFYHPIFVSLYVISCSSILIHVLKHMCLNPLTPVLPITMQPWWTLAFLPLLTWSLLTKIGIICTHFWRRKRSFQWCPDQSDRPNGAWDMHKNAQKVERKTRRKISCHYTWLLNLKIARLNDAFLEVF